MIPHSTAVTGGVVGTRKNHLLGLGNVYFIILEWNSYYTQRLSAIVLWLNFQNAEESLLHGLDMKCHPEVHGLEHFISS